MLSHLCGSATSYFYFYFYFYFFFFKSTIYNTVLERSLWAHNTNSAYSKTMLRIARYYTTKCLGTSFWWANAGRNLQIFQDNVALSSGEKVKAPPTLGLRTQ
jgi:hypothetical protein